MQAKLKRNNHFVPICYQKGFADSSKKVWVKFAGQQKPVHWSPKCVGKEQNLYIRSVGGVEDDKFEDFFDKQVENDFARLSQRVKREQDQLSTVTGKELGALGKFVASQTVRTLANRLCMEEQLCHALNSNEFLAEMGKQWTAILRSWQTDLPGFDFYTSLPHVRKYFITGDNPVLLIVENDNPIWTPTDEPQRAAASPVEILDNPKASFRVALSPYMCVYLHAHGGGEAHLPPQTMEPSGVRSFNDLIRKQCNLFILARDEESLT